MSAGKGFCSKHQFDISGKLKFLGLWDKVKAFDAAGMADIARAWMHGQLRKDMICPLIVMGMEIQAKANRMADQLGGTQGAHVTTCPLCAIVRMSNDPAADVKVIRGMGDVVLALMQSNGQAGGDPSPALNVKNAYRPSR